MSALRIDQASVMAGDRLAVEGLSLTVEAGETHVIMGRNGSGKSSLANALMDKPGYVFSKGSVLLDGLDALSMDATGRARAGLFVASQYPVEIQGLSNGHFLRAMANNLAQEQGRDPWSAGAFLTEAKKCCARLGIAEDFLQRGLNFGMSGGERKRNELLQLRFFEPKVAVLDEIDSGLDVDAWGKAVEFIGQEQKLRGFGLVIISHYAKIARKFSEATVHVLANGRIEKTGDGDLARLIEERGFEEALR